MANKKSIDISEILKDAFETIKKNPEIIGLYVIQLVIILIAGFGILGSSMSFFRHLSTGTTNIFEFFKSLSEIVYKLLAFGIIIFVVQTITMGSAISLVASIKRGQKTSVREALITGVKKSPYLIAGGIVAGLAIGVGFIALIIPGIYLLLRLILYPQACVIDGSLGIEKSWNITKKYFWDVLVLFIVLTIIALVISAIPFGNIINYLLVSPWTITSWTILYLKIRK